mgnify:CR=1 FL=1
MYGGNDSSRKMPPMSAAWFSKSVLALAAMTAVAAPSPVLLDVKSTLAGAVLAVPLLILLGILYCVALKPF